jgi:hypothetical protein
LQKGSRQGVGHPRHRPRGLPDHGAVVQLDWVPIELVFDQVLVFPKAKDRPILFSA